MVQAEIIGRYLLDHPREMEAYKRDAVSWMQAANEGAFRGSSDLSGRSGAGVPGPPDPRFSEMASRAVRAWARVVDADPQAKASYQANAEMSIEIMRRQMMPAWQVKRLRQAEAGE